MGLAGTVKVNLSLLLLLDWPLGWGLSFEKVYVGRKQPRGPLLLRLDHFRETRLALPMPRPDRILRSHVQTAVLLLDSLHSFLYILRESQTILVDISIHKFPKLREARVMQPIIIGIFTNRVRDGSWVVAENGRIAPFLWLIFCKSE